MDPVDLVSDITSAIVQHFQDKGVDLSIDVAEEGEPGAAPEEPAMDEPLADEPPAEEEPAEEPDLMEMEDDELTEEEDIDGMLERAGVSLQELDDDLINEVTLRVAKRLIKATKK